MAAKDDLANPTAKKNQTTREKFETAWLEDVTKNTGVSDKTSNETPPKTNKKDSSLQKKRIEGLLRVLLEKEEVSFNTSNKSLTISRNDSRQSGIPEKTFTAPVKKIWQFGLGRYQNFEHSS